MGVTQVQLEAKRRSDAVQAQGLQGLATGIRKRHAGQQSTAAGDRDDDDGDDGAAD